MKAMVHKTRSVGWSCVSIPKSKIKLRHLLLYFPVFLEEFGGKFDLPMLIGQVTLVRYFENPFGEVQEANHVQVIHQRVADVIDLSTAIFMARVGKEEGGVVREGPRGQVDQIPLRVLPDCMEFGFDEDAGCLPDGPAYQLFSAVTDHLLWDDAKAFAHWLAGQGFAWDQNGRLVRGNMAAEFGDVS